MRRAFFLGSFIFLSLGAAISAHAAVSSKVIERAAREYVTRSLSVPVHHLQIDIESLSKNLTLPDCPAIDVAYDNPRSQFTLGRRALLVSCHHPRWQIYVSVNAYGEVPVATTTEVILKNQSITEDNVALQEMSSQRLQDTYFTSWEDLKGTMAKTDIPKGTILRSGMLRRQYDVLAGTKVSIEMNTDQFFVRMAGVTMGDAMIGDVIQVKNASSGRIIHAKVVSDLVVVVN